MKQFNRRASIFAVGGLFYKITGMCVKGQTHKEDGPAKKTVKPLLEVLSQAFIEAKKVVKLSSVEIHLAGITVNGAKQEELVVTSYEPHDSEVIVTKAWRDMCLGALKGNPPEKLPAIPPDQYFGLIDGDGKILHVLQIYEDKHMLGSGGMNVAKVHQVLRRENSGKRGFNQLYQVIPIYYFEAIPIESKTLNSIVKLMEHPVRSGK